MKKTITFIFLFFIFITSPKAYDLTIQNIQNDNITNTYTYEINIYKASGAYEYIYNNIRSYIVFDASGTTKITLNNNESITITNLPESSYQIKQNINSNYNTYINNTHTILYNGNTKKDNIVTFNNKTKTSQNPNTSSKITTLNVIIIITIITLIYLKNKKIKRYI